MSDLILGADWLAPVHSVPGRPFGGDGSAPASVVGVLGQRARETPDAPFLTDLTGQRPPHPLTYGLAHLEVQRRAGLLAQMNLARGERVGVLGENSVEFVFAVLAVLEAGGVAVLLSQRDPPARIATLVELTQVRFLLHDSERASVAGACSSLESSRSFEQLARLSVPVGGDRRGGGARGGDSWGGRGSPKPTDGALIVFTSGTTGKPKAVVLSHFAVAQNAACAAAHHRIAPGIRLLCVLPLHHVNGLGFTIFGALLGGGHTIVARGFDGLSFWPIVREHGVHIISLVPNLLSLLADRPSLRGDDLPLLRYAASAAAPLSIGVAERAWDRLGLRIVQGYGLSEATNFSCLMPTDLADFEYRRWMLAGRRTSIGPALPGQQVEVHNEEGGVTSPGEEGEIVIRGHCLMSGYLHDPEATDTAFRGGWFHTGDLGYALPDDRGRPFLHVSGRIREIAKRSGALVSLLELDEVIAAFPGVADAGSASFPNRWVDEEIAAVVVPARDAVLTQEAIIEHCRRLLSFAATPKAIEIVSEVPRTPSGKIVRAEIARRFVGLRDRLFLERRTDSSRSA